MWLVNIFRKGKSHHEHTNIYLVLKASIYKFIFEQLESKISIHNTKQKLKPKWQDYLFTTKSTPYLHNSFSNLIDGNIWDEPNTNYPSSKSENTFVVLIPGTNYLAQSC